MQIEGQLKIMSGWIKGRVWDGLNIKKGCKVTHWKRNYQEHEVRRE